MFFYNYYWLALIPLVIAMIASANVKSTYSKYEKIKNGRGLTGAMAARQILDANGLYNIWIEYVGRSAFRSFLTHDQMLLDFLIQLITVLPLRQ